MRRSRKRNSGKSLENLIQQSAKVYETRGKLVLEKADPPSFTVTIGNARQTRLLSNPFPDFVGSYTEHGGIFLGIEAKSTKEERLAFGKSGIRQKQLDLLYRWKRAGGFVGVIWQTPTGFFWVGLEDVEQAVKNGKKSVKSENLTEIVGGVGMAMDFEDTIRRKYLF